jgi:flagellar basal-body rod protein FlgB
MEPVQLYALASRHAEWLAARQVAVSNNVANANVTGYRAAEAVPFEAYLASTASATQPGDNAAAATRQSDHRVSIESELVESSDIRREHELNTAIVSAFHRMFQLTARP